MGSGWQVLWLVSVLGMSGAMVNQLVRLTTVFFSVIAIIIIIIIIITIITTIITIIIMMAVRGG